MADIAEQIDAELYERAEKAFAEAIALCRAHPMREPPGMAIYRVILAERASIVDAVMGTFCVLFLDGRNEHGSHVIPSYPCSIDLDKEDVAEQAEAILCEAERLGFIVGMDHVWAEFTWVEPQVGEYGQVELNGYWDFKRINAAMTHAILSHPPHQDTSPTTLSEMNGGTV